MCWWAASLQRSVFLTPDQRHWRPDLGRHLGGAGHAPQPPCPSAVRHRPCPAGPADPRPHRPVPHPEHRRGAPLGGVARRGRPPRIPEAVRQGRGTARPPRCPGWAFFGRGAVPAGGSSQPNVVGPPFPMKGDEITPSMRPGFYFWVPPGGLDLGGGYFRPVSCPPCARHSQEYQSGGPPPPPTQQGLDFQLLCVLRFVPLSEVL